MPWSPRGIVGALVVAAAASQAAAQGPAMAPMAPAASVMPGSYYPLGPGYRPMVAAAPSSTMPMLSPPPALASPAATMMMPSTFGAPAAMPAPTATAPACASGECGSAPCCGADGCCAAPCCPWYGGVAALFLARTRPNTTHFSFESTTPGICRMQSNDPGLFDTTWGGEVLLGRRFGCCGNFALEGLYWGLDPLDERIDRSIPGLFLNTPIGLNNPLGGPALEIGGNTLDFWFDGAGAHMLERRNEIHNVEANGLFWAAPMSDQRRLSLALLGGFRYFRFDEGLLFGGLRPGGNWGGNGGLDECYMDFDVTNDLFGGQLGARAQLALGPRLGLFATPKVGVFGNSAEQRTQIYRGDGVHALDLSSTDGSVAVLGQIDTGVNFAFTDVISGFVGYRLIGISGIAQADNQVISNVHFTEDILDVDTSGDLFLHGAFMGLMFNY